ncbi:MAG: hypothetical protein WCH40_06040, partial [Verrucomicrobiales bacterium]
KGVLTLENILIDSSPTATGGETNSINQGQSMCLKYFCFSSNPSSFNSVVGADEPLPEAGRDLAAVAKFLNEQVAAFPKLMWRLDFNETSEAPEMAEFLKSLPDDTRRRIDFIEDPCPYSETTWTNLKLTTGVRLAVDRQVAPNCDAAQVMVLKPALDEPWLLAEAAAKRGRQLVVTSYMDHPLGQCFAAWEAARLGLTFRGLVPVCGLQTHHLFEPNAFSEYLGAWSPTFHPPGGRGLGFDDLLDALVWTRLI